MANLSEIDVARLTGQAEFMLGWGQQAAIEGGPSLQSAIGESWEAAKQLFHSKRGHEAAVMRATVKALEALYTLEVNLKDCGVEVDRLVAAKLGGKSLKKATPPPPEETSAGGGDLPLVVIQPAPPKKKKPSGTMSSAIVKSAQHQPLKALKAAFVSTYLQSPSLVLGISIYRALGRLALLGLPLFCLNLAVYGSLLLVLACCAFPRLGARALYHLSSQIPGLMWHILEEFADEFSAQLFGVTSHCPDHCFFSAADNSTDAKNTQRGIPAHHPPAQPPTWFLSGVVSVLTAIVTTRWAAPAAQTPGPR